MAVWEFKYPTAITPKMELKGHKSVPRAIDPNDPDSPNAKNKDLNRSSPDMNLIENIGVHEEVHVSPYYCQARKYRRIESRS